MFRLRSIAARIALGYLVVILLTAVLVGSSFWLLLSRQLEQSARDSLFRDARNLAGVVSGLDELTGDGTGRRGMGGMGGMGMRRQMHHWVLGRTIQGEYLLINAQGVVLESSVTGVPAGAWLDPAVVEKLAASEVAGGRVTLGEERYVAAARYLEGDYHTGGAVVLLTRVEGLAEIRRDLGTIFLASLGLASLAALGLTVLLARRISHPLLLLKEKAHQVAQRNFGRRVELGTGDEIGELGEAINAMDEKLAEYDRVQKQFFQNASHELKSPLMSIQGYAEGIKEGIFSGQERDGALEIIVRETGRLKNLVDELVYLGRLESTTGIYLFEETDLGEVLEQALDAQRGAVLEKNIGLKLHGHPEVTLWADGEKLVRVFVNVLANAVRYARTRVQVVVEQPGDGWVRVTVQDDGEGFTGEDLLHLWERFYKGRRGGSGLGLSIAWAIVEEHGGSMQARNIPGGAELTVSLPTIG